MSSPNPYIYECAVFGDFHDPLAVRRLLTIRSEGNFNAWLDDSRSNDPVVQFKAHDCLLPVVRLAFNLPPIDPLTGTGVADEQALLVLDAFLEWLEGKG